MANFAQAIKWMKEGKKVKIKTWMSVKYIYYSPNYMSILDNHNVKIKWLCMSQFESKDWVICKEKKKPETLSRFQISKDGGETWEDTHPGVVTFDYNAS